VSGPTVPRANAGDVCRGIRVAASADEALLENRRRLHPGMDSELRLSYAWRRDHPSPGEGARPEERGPQSTLRDAMDPSVAPAPAENSAPSMDWIVWPSHASARCKNEAWKSRVDRRRRSMHWVRRLNSRLHVARH